MRRLAAVLGVAMVGSGLTAQPIVAAVEIAVSVSPADGVVGRPMEVLVRTFAPVGADDLTLPAPSLTYPGATGLWNVLYPIPDYPFNVEARSPTGETTKIELARDPVDATLWRGDFIPTVAGEWTIVMRNFPTSAPTRVMVTDGPALPNAAVFGVAAFIAGLLGGLVLGRLIRRPGVAPG